MKASVVSHHRRDYDLGWKDCRSAPRIRRRYIYEVTRFGTAGEEHYRPSWDIRAGMRLTAIWQSLDPELRSFLETLLVIFALVLFGVVGALVLHGWSTQ